MKYKRIIKLKKITRQKGGLPMLKKRASEQNCIVCVQDLVKPYLLPVPSELKKM